MGSRCAPDIAKAFLLTKIVIFFLCEKSCLQLNEIKRTFLFLFKAFSISSPSIEHLNKISNISDLFFPTIKLGLCCLDMKLWTILAKNFCWACLVKFEARYSTFYTFDWSTLTMFWRSDSFLSKTCFSALCFSMSSFWSSMHSFLFGIKNKAVTKNLVRIGCFKFSLFFFCVHIKTKFFELHLTKTWELKYNAKH